MRFVKDYRIIGQHFLALSFEISRDSARIKKLWKRIHQRELITLIYVFVKTNKLGTIDDLLSSIRFQRTFLITARLCFSRHLLSDRIDMITFNSPFRKGKVEVVVA